MIVLNLFFLLLNFVCCEANEWQSIVPLKSTRAEVVKLVGKPMYGSKAKDASSYETKTEKVTVIYSSGLCSVNDSNGWNLPELTVISVSVYPNVRPKFNDLKLDKKQFEQHIDPELTYLTYYTSEKDGISITVDTNDGEVTRFSYSPKSKYNNLKCEQKK